MLQFQEKGKNVLAPDTTHNWVSLCLETIQNSHAKHKEDTKGPVNPYELATEGSPLSLYKHYMHCWLWEILGTAMAGWELLGQKIIQERVRQAGVLDKAQHSPCNNPPNDTVHIARSFAELLKAKHGQKINWALNNSPQWRAESLCLEEQCTWVCQIPDKCQ